MSPVGLLWPARSLKGDAVRYTILSIEDQPNGMARVTIDTRTFGHAQCVVPKDALDSAGVIIMLDRLWDQKENIRTLVRKNGTRRTL